jgi:serine O-acetyltransferase
MFFFALEYSRAMDSTKFTQVIDQAVRDLCDEAASPVVFRHAFLEKALPSVDELARFIDLTRAVIFPGFFGIQDTRRDALKYHLGHNLEAISRIIANEGLSGLCFDCGHDSGCVNCGEQSEKIALEFIGRIPEIRRLLSLDVEAAFDGDPAAKSHAEIIFCYPSVTALTHHRIAHELFALGLPIIPRVISEMAHSATGIDIHPGATIGERFFIDHGTGVVIGETSVIGDNVRLYQGVTLGAKSFPKDSNGNPIKGIPRHPIVQDNVIVYSGATILGRITVGKGSVVGANTWVTEDVPPGSKVSSSA